MLIMIHFAQGVISSNIRSQLTGGFGMSGARRSLIQRLEVARIQTRRTGLHGIQVWHLLMTMTNTKMWLGVSTILFYGIPSSIK